MTRRLCQADDDVADRKLGRSKKTTIRKAGCLGTALAEILRELKIDVQANAVTVQNKAIVAWMLDHPNDERFAPYGPGKAGAVIDRVGAANGLRVSERVGADDGVVAMREAVCSALGSGGRALMHVDDDHVDDDDDPVHWVTALRLEGADVVYADPANGQEGRLALVTLAGASTRGDKRPYRCLGVRAVHKA